MEQTTGRSSTDLSTAIPMCVSNLAESPVMQCWELDGTVGYVPRRQGTGNGLGRNQ